MADHFDDLIQTLKTLPAREGAQLVSLYNERIRSAARPGPLNDIWYGGYSGLPTMAGNKVDEKSALKFGPVYAAVKRISESVASLPLNLYHLAGRNKNKALDHPLYRLLHLQPNPEQTRIQMWESLISHLLLCGNAYAHIPQTLLGEPTALWPLDPLKMQVKRSQRTGVLVYEYTMTDTGEKFLFPPWEILHIGGLGFNGLVGYSVIGLMRESIGLGMAQEEFSSRFYSNGASPLGVLETGGPLEGDARADLQRWWDETYGGMSNSHKTVIAGPGLKFHPLTIPQKDAQFLETRNFSVRDVARWFGIPPHMIGDMADAKWANIEAQGIDYVVYTLRPILVRAEQAMEVKFNLGPEYEIRHVVEGLLRGDSAARSALYHEALIDGWMNRNEVRELEDRNPANGLDEFLIPSNNATPVLPGGNGKDSTLNKEAFRMMFQKLSRGERADLAEMLRCSDAS
jgi:HK97 family phage portal protein